VSLATSPVGGSAIRRSSALVMRRWTGDGSYTPPAHPPRRNDLNAAAYHVVFATGAIGSPPSTRCVVA